MRLLSYYTIYYLQENVTYSSDEEDLRLKHMNMLKTALRTQPMR